MSVTILHLTDIHAGKKELKDEDLKVKIPDAERGKMLDRVTEYLQALPATPDFVAVTGDLTIQGDPEGLETFRSWMAERIAEKTLPPFNRIMVVPGNHDVKWGVQKRPGWHKERYELFYNTVAKLFPHPYLPDCDPKPNPAALDITPNTQTLVGGIKTKKKLGQVEVTSSWPFILDLRNDILIYGFNSTLGCGVYLPASQKVTDPLDGLLKGYKGERPGELAKQIQDGYQESLLVDAGFVGEDQLTYFGKIINRLRRKLGTKYSRLTKIALLHHHVSHLWQQQLEVKTFESVLDAARLKQKLIEYEFDLVLHGHKHTNHVALDGSVIPLNSQRQFSPLCISSGGTIGGYPRLQDRQSFKLIVLDEEKGPRTKALIREVPLNDADPRNVMATEAKIYSVPLSSRLPGLHDLAPLKQKADDFIRDACAPELGDPEKVVMAGAELRIPSTNSDLISGAQYYTCHRVLETPGAKTYYDIFLAPKALGFKQRARLYWMLNDVRSLSESSEKQVQVVLMIGNLEETHFFQGSRRGEVARSIDEMKRFFGPAIKKRLLEVRVHPFSQDEVEALIRGEIAADGGASS